MSKYQNGFYVYHPHENIDFLGDFEPLSLPQIIQIIEDQVWVTNVSLTYELFEVLTCGVIGRMVFTQEGEEVLANWREVGDFNIAKDKPLPRTLENFDRIILMRDELITEQKQEISKLKEINNKLEQKLIKYRGQ